MTVLLHEKLPVGVFASLGDALDVLDRLECLDDGFWIWQAVAEPIVTELEDFITFEAASGDERAAVAVRGERRASGAAAPVALSLSGTKRN